VSAANKTLEVYFIDVEGGQSTLFVTPSGHSILVDAGWPGINGRDADRILKAAKQAGIDKIDYLLCTHYHVDHVGGIPELAARIPVRNFVDHGPNQETGRGAENLWAAYEKAVAKGKRIIVNPGDKIPVPGLDIDVLTARGEKIEKPLKGAGQPNPHCAGVAEKEPDPSENGKSVGFLLTFGKFRLLDLADLTWNKELGLVCPNNPIGKVDVFVVSHHGMDISNTPALVNAVYPRVAVMNNGARKGGIAAAWQVVRKSPGLEDLWQLHFAIAGGKDNNSREEIIANPEEHCQGHWVKLSASPDGTFTVENGRNGYKKTYKPQGK
jgi:beta-lactamase superfamily II metal-dependent hydrolase